MNSPYRLMVAIGARPQFVKAAALQRVWAERSSWQVTWVHTGQHHDEALSAQFFEELELPQPDVMLSVRHSSRAARMGDMMEGVQSAIQSHRPDAVLVFGDTDSTLAAAWASSAEGVPLIHVEAGLRSGLWSMPEEVNRVLTDRLSSVLVCPSAEAVRHLKREGIDHRWSGQGWPQPQAPCVFQTGDIMHDNAVHYGSQLSADATSNGRVLMTLHRPSNVDDQDRLMAWMDAVGGWAKSNGIRVRFPVHPRTRAVFNAHHVHWEDTLALHGIDVESPLGYLETLRAVMQSPLVLTDSGGVQKEAYSLGRRCVVLRETTEWMDQVRRGQSALASEPEELNRLANEMMEAGPFPTDELYGNGHAAQSIVDLLERMWVQ